MRRRGGAPAGHDVEAVDLCFADDARALVTGAIRDFAPDVVGISLRNLDNSAYPENSSYIDDYRSLMSWVRETSGAPVVLGGAGFTVMPATILEELHADYGVVGEGEHAFPWLLGEIESSFRRKEESEDRLKRFVGDASHELRTPLTSIRGYADLCALHERAAAARGRPSEGLLTGACSAACSACTSWEREPPSSSTSARWRSWRASRSTRSSTTSSIFRCRTPSASAKRSRAARSTSSGRDT